MAFREVTGSSAISSYWPKKAAERKVGDEVTGVYKSKQERVNPDGSKSILYLLETSNGTVGVNGSSALILRAMEEIPTGSTVKIIFQGKQRSQKTGREYNNFQVLVDDDAPVEEAENNLENLDF